MSECSSLASIVKSASSILSDQEPGFEFEAFSESTLLTYACEIIPLLASIHPDKFTGSKDITIGSGVVDVSAERCDPVSITSFSVGGVDVPASRVQDAEQLRRFSAWPDPCVYACMDGERPAPSSVRYAFDADNKNLLTVSPPPAPGQEYTAHMQCRDERSFVADPEKPLPPRAADLIPAIREWVLFSATSTDDETADGCAANVHYQAFLQLVPAASSALKLRAKSIAQKQ